MSSYDTILYPGYTHPQTHPSRLEVIARLYGLDAPPAQRSRILELGCGTGSNLIPLAWSLPQSEHVGIDLAARPIAHGQEMIRDLALTNIRLIHGNILQIDDTWGQFDYIIAHGFYSWVPPAVQEHMLALCRRALTPRGVAFVSYNALPGCHLRNMLREMMLFHIRDYTTPRERIDQAVALVKFLATAQDTQDEYRLWMKAELQRIIEHQEGHLYHDELAETNEPLYFPQFLQRAARHHLQYLGEADFFEMSDHIFTEPVRATLQQLAPQRILREQYLDFLKCRRFRQTLLTHQETKLSHEPQAAAITHFHITSAAQCTSTESHLHPHSHATYETPKGGKLETDYPLGKAALTLLGENWPRHFPYHQLQEQAQALLQQSHPNATPDPDPGEHLSQFLLQLYSAGIVEFRTVAPRMTYQASARPQASPVARWQVAREEFVTSALHVAVKIEDDVGKALLSWLDGTHDRAALLEKLWQFLRSKNALPNGDEATARRELAQQLEANLAKLARFGLLVE